MPRYFVEVAYKGTRYSGFQVQENANTIQAEVEKAINTIQGNSPGSVSTNKIELTGSSRTDTGVHALQNYFHFDYDLELHPQLVYKLNAVLPPDIVVKKVYLVTSEAHCRFDAISRKYTYRMHTIKDPFLRDTSLYYPYNINRDLLEQAAAYVKGQTNFFAFSKTNTQVKNFSCSITKSEWSFSADKLIYTIEGNRFLRGMVRLVTASIVRVGREKLSLEEFHELFNGERKCGYSVPAHGLFLEAVLFPGDVLR